MSGTQMMLVIGGIALFSMLLINVHKSVLNSEEQQISAEYISIATTVAQDMLEEVSNKNFDEATLNNADYDASLITAPASLGPETGESLTTYDDVDDYNSYTRTVSTLRGGDFSVKVTVNYVDDDDYENDLSVKSRTKKIDVAVYNPYLPDTLHFNYFKSY